ncbi:hypothetical protein KY284_021833 [Solanum tuberosum]|nr:hypothetical protein KY284_021833 [Solanum tuberosum]
MYIQNKKRVFEERAIEQQEEEERNTKDQEKKKGNPRTEGGKKESRSKGRRGSRWGFGEEGVLRISCTREQSKKKQKRGWVG